MSPSRTYTRRGGAAKAALELHSLEHVQCVLSLMEVAAKHLCECERFCERLVSCVFGLLERTTKLSRSAALAVLTAFLRALAGSSLAASFVEEALVPCLLSRQAD